MKLEKAVRLALEKVREHHLHNWTVAFNHSKTTAGTCDSEEKIITLSRVFIELWDKKEVEDTILHEIAHALSPSEDHHSEEWKKTAKKIGARPEAKINKKAWNKIKHKIKDYGK